MVVAIIFSGRQQWSVQTSFILMPVLVKLSLPSSARQSCHLCTSRFAFFFHAVLKTLLHSPCCAMYTNAFHFCRAAPLTSTQPHLRCDVGLKEGGY